MISAPRAAGFGKPGSIHGIVVTLLPVQMRKEAVALLREMGARDREIATILGIGRKALKRLVETEARPFRGAEDMAGEE